MSHSGLWLTLIALGAYHGVNPAMGWLFAVSQGMQQGSRQAVLRSLLPIALGHELSIALVAVVVYEKLGVQILRRAWVNTDQLWAAAFVVAAGVTLFS